MNEVIDLNETDITDLKIQTSYCVSQEIHELQVRAAIARKLPGVQPQPISYDALAVVCSGPSLKTTWEELKGFSKILTVSGAHDFLIEKGIVPNWHMETDPRKHKSVFVAHPHKDVRYLIASCCHPQVFDSLKDHQVQVWHVYGSETVDTFSSTYPRGQWALTGGSNVGMRALVMARMLGFVNVHIFGMDCSSDSKVFHANAHPNEPKAKSLRTVQVGEQIFHTTEVFLEYARQFFKETLMLPDVQFTLHGEGLLQALAVKRFMDPKLRERDIAERQKRMTNQTPIAMAAPETISAEYAEQNRRLHLERADYGCGGARHAEMVAKLVPATNSKTVLDYGCGKGELARALPFPIWEYDPAIPGKDRAPRAADLVICTDVLEHIEPEYLDAVLSDLARCTKKVGYFVVNTAAASKTLPDGRNTHLIQQGKEWWNEQLSKYFQIATLKTQGTWLHVVVSAKSDARLELVTAADVKLPSKVKRNRQTRRRPAWKTSA